MILNPVERLIVAADFKPNLEKGEGRTWVRRQVLDFATKLSGVGVYLKINSALRACGYDLIKDLHDAGIRVFADLKLDDIPETLSIDGALLYEVKPELLTVKCSAGFKSLQALKAALPETEVLGVTTLTSLTDVDSYALFRRSVQDSVMAFAQVAAEARIDGLISSPKEVEELRQKFGDRLSLNTPGIRPTWHIQAGDQNPERIMTPAKAIKAGADRIVVGRPITQAADPVQAVMWTLDEIDAAMQPIKL
ncbi:MAG: orotidine-5'-phosphate decarboxylase [Patescibacteria group bacterium]